MNPAARTAQGLGQFTWQVTCCSPLGQLVLIIQSLPDDSLPVNEPQCGSVAVHTGALDCA